MKMSSIDDEIIKAVHERFPREILLEMFYEQILSQPGGEETLQETFTYEQLLEMTREHRPPSIPEPFVTALAKILWNILPEENKATPTPIQ